MTLQEKRDKYARRRNALKIEIQHDRIEIAAEIAELNQDIKHLFVHILRDIKSNPALEFFKVVS